MKRNHSGGTRSQSKREMRSHTLKQSTKFLKQFPEMFWKVKFKYEQEFGTNF